MRLSSPYRERVASVQTVSPRAGFVRAASPGRAAGAVSLAVGLLLAACVNAGPTMPQSGTDAPPNDAVTAGFDEPFALRVGETGRVGSDGLELRFDRVASDSRCPIDVTCVWEGDGVVVVVARQSPELTASLELHTHPSFPVEAEYASARIRLIALAPQPRESAPPTQADYVATFTVVAR